MFLGLWRGIPYPSQRLPTCLQGRPLRKSIDAACILEKRGTKSIHIFKKVGGRLRGERLLLKHIFALYSLPIIVSKIFSFAMLTWLRFILHLEMQACNVLYQPHLYIFLFFGCHYSRVTAFKSHWKRAYNCTKVHIKCPNFFCGDGGGGEKGGRGRREFGGGERHDCWGIDASLCH